jgi:hypothetical protein
VGFCCEKGLPGRGIGVIRLDIECELWFEEVLGAVCVSWERLFGLGICLYNIKN